MNTAVTGGYYGKNVLNTDLTGKVAVVTGASGTLCSIFAKALARAGAKVALLGRNMDKLKELADEIEAEGGIAKGYTCNVMNRPTVCRWPRMYWQTLAPAISL